jgi:hypothetical protein
VLLETYLEISSTFGAFSFVNINCARRKNSGGFAVSFFGMYLTNWHGYLIGLQNKKSCWHQLSNVLL